MKIDWQIENESRRDTSEVEKRIQFRYFVYLIIPLIVALLVTVSYWNRQVILDFFTNEPEVLEEFDFLFEKICEAVTGNPDYEIVLSGEEALVVSLNGENDNRIVIPDPRQNVFFRPSGDLSALDYIVELNNALEAQGVSISRTPVQNANFFTDLSEAQIAPEDIIGEPLQGFTQAEVSEKGVKDQVLLISCES